MFFKHKTQKSWAQNSTAQPHYMYFCLWFLKSKNVHIQVFTDDIAQ